jgi:A/G-specific adenine glycosylase
VEDGAGIPVEAQDSILAWYAERGRPLAFRRTTDPYAILFSEAMAQQTQAARAAAHWERFMTRFPTVGSLAAATPADVLREWQGLGYDRRALALQRAARAIRDVHGGRVPDSLEALLTLPGVGPYTARAVMAIAFGRPVGAVDVNVRRVLGRMVAGDPGTLRPDEMQTLADGAVPAGRSAAWTHAVMDLGATVCRPRGPRCGACPAQAWCRRAAAIDATQDRAMKRLRRDRAPTFPTTTRWLRGRILDLLRAAPGDAWVALDEPIGEHDLARVTAAARAMAGDGLVELDGPASSDPVRARLATS